MKTGKLSFRAAGVSAALALAAAAGLAAYFLRPGPTPPAPETARIAKPAPFRYAVEYPAIGYSTSEPTGRVARLAGRLAAGTETLEFREGRGYLDALLRALDIDPSSQALVFSKTSLQSSYVSPETPRAIYFNDDTYVAWEQGAPLVEIASLDTDLGVVYYTLRQSRAVNVRFGRQLDGCLRCHDTYGLTGGGVPRLLLGSGYIGTNGQLVTHEGWILTTDSTPLSSRWGGWYVTGRPAEQRHLGNLVVGDPAELQHLDTLRVGTLERLDALLDTSPYSTNKSDIVALLVLQHQVTVQNLLVRASFETRTALAADAGSDPASARRIVEKVTEPLVRAMLFVDAAPVEGPIAGTSGFEKQFESRGPRDEAGRSLRDLDLETRVFRYPLSYLIDSEAFGALPEPAKAHVYERLAEILSGEDASPDFARLSPQDRRSILEILTDTDAAFAAAYARFEDSRPLVGGRAVPPKATSAQH